MAPEQSFLRKLGCRAWGILLGILLILCVHFWPDHDAKSPSIRIARANGVGLGGALVWASDLGMYESSLLHSGNTLESGWLRTITGITCSLTVELDDNDKYSAHTGLLGRSIRSTPSLQDVDKALSNPQAVIQDLAGSNGQNCFAYKGDCVNINDNNAMAQACGAGNTPIGWDDAGCGKKNCVSVHSRLLLISGLRGLPSNLTMMI
jgi:hypothetical protein